MILTGEPIDAAEARSFGLVTKVTTPDKTVEEALRMAAKIASLSKPVIAMAKECVNAAYEMTQVKCGASEALVVPLEYLGGIAHICTGVCLHVYGCACMCVCVRLRVCLCVCACWCACVPVCFWSHVLDLGLL